MREDWTAYFMGIADLVAQRSTCLRRKVGAVAVKDKRIISTGYNGAPSGMEHCAKVGCLRQELGIPSGQRHEICRAVHAEQNVIVEAARFGIPLVGAELYCTTLSCLICAKMLINCGIKRVFYREEYSDPMTIAMFNAAGVELVNLNKKGTDMNENKKEQLAKNLSWMCKREAESGGKGETLCPCLPQNSCPWDMEGKTCPATYQDWLEWMEADDVDRS